MDKCNDFGLLWNRNLWGGGLINDEESSVFGFSYLKLSLSVLALEIPTWRVSSCHCPSDDALLTAQPTGHGVSS